MLLTVNTFFRCLLLVHNTLSAGASERPGLQFRVRGINLGLWSSTLWVAFWFVFFFFWIEFSSPRHVQTALTPNIQAFAVSQVRPLEHFPSTFISCRQHPYSVTPSHNPTQSTAWPQTGRIQQDFCTSLCNIFLNCFLWHWKRPQKASGKDTKIKIW